MSKKKKIIIIVISVLAVLILAAVGAAAYIVKDAAATMMTVTETPGTGIYSIDYKVDYDLDSLLGAGGTDSPAKAVEKIKQNALKLIPAKSDNKIPAFEGVSYFAKTPDNTFISARNFDSADTDILIVNTFPADGFASVSTVPLRCLGINGGKLKLQDKMNMLLAPLFPFDGVNEKGLSVALMQIKADGTVQDNGGTDIYPMLAVRAMLDKTSDITEAVMLLMSFDLQSEEKTDYQFHIADRSGASVVVSFENGELTSTEKQSIFQVCGGAYLNAVAFDYEKTSEENLSELTKVLRNNMGTVTSDQGIDLLDYVSSDKTDKTTQWSVVYDLEKASLSLCSHKDYSKMFVASAD